MPNQRGLPFENYWVGKCISSICLLLFGLATVLSLCSHVEATSSLYLQTSTNKLRHTIMRDDPSLPSARHDGPETRRRSRQRTAKRTAERPAERSAGSARQRTSPLIPTTGSAPAIRSSVNLGHAIQRRETGLLPRPPSKPSKSTDEPFLPPRNPIFRHLPLSSAPETLHFPNDTSTIQMGGIPFRTRKTTLQVEDREIQLKCVLGLMQAPARISERGWHFAIGIPRDWSISSTALYPHAEVKAGKSLQSHFVE